MPTHSYWLDEALAAEPSSWQRLERAHTADVCIVGGGFTGLWSAIEIKRREPSARVVVVERQLCGSGASGRNGGFVLSLWAKFLALQAMCGTDEALRLCRLSSDAVHYLGEFCQEHRIDADFRQDGWLWAATSQAQIGAWSTTVATLERLGQTPFQAMSPDEVAARAGSRCHLAGVFEPVSASVQPARLARGLKRVAMEAGVEIYEQSPMLRLERTARPRVICPHGAIQAGKVILAMNAWGVQFAEIRKSIFVVSSDMVITAPVPELLQQMGWTTGMTISDSRMLVHYYRTTRDGRIAFGKGGGSGTLAFGRRVGPGFDGDSPIASTVERYLRSTYPALRDVACDRGWTGPIDRSKNGLPVFGAFHDHPQILYGVGYSGNGVGPSLLGGRILASLALERRDEWAGAGLVQRLKRAFPPEPFRYVGGKLVRAAISKRDGADDAGTQASLLVRALAGLAPAGLSPVRKSEVRS